MYIRGKEVIFSIVLLLASGGAWSQQLDAIGKSEPLTVSGSLSSNFVGYGTTGNNYGREAFTSYISGSLNFDIYGVALPFTFSYSSQSTGRFQQPFNQVAMHPRYKWLTAHIGFTSMNFSSHSLSGHTFSGVGIEAAPPGRFKLSAMYGRLVKPVAFPADSLGHDIVPSYARWGGGLKASVLLDKHTFDFIVFKAKDDINSIAPPPDSCGVKPKDNLVLGINVSSRLTDKLTFGMEFTGSMLTQDIRVARDTSSSLPLPRMGALLGTNSTSAMYKSMKGRIDYSLGPVTVGAAYERIDPGYITLGAYYATNDIENITANAGISLWQGKCQFSGSLGKQRNNLDGKQSSPFTTWVGSGTLGLTPNDKMNVSLSYSNFQTYMHIRSAFDDATQLTEYDNLDTLRYSQISQNMSAASTFRLSSSTDKVQMLSLSLNGAFTNENQTGETANSDGVVCNGNLLYVSTWSPRRLTISGGASMGYTSFGSTPRSWMFGPTLNASKSFLEGKLSAALGSTYSFQRSGGSIAGSVLNVRSSLAYSIGGKKDEKGKQSDATQQLGLTAVCASRFKSTSNTKKFTDYTITFTYTCNLLPQKYWLGTKPKADKNRTKENE